jgi:hypothetical protein
MSFQLAQDLFSLLHRGDLSFYIIIWLFFIINVFFLLALLLFCLAGGRAGGLLARPIELTVVPIATKVPGKKRHVRNTISASVDQVLSHSNLVF